MIKFAQLTWNFFSVPISRTWESILWKILSCACFAGINILVRYLSGGSQLSITTPLPIYTIMFFQNIIGALIILPILFKNQPLYNLSKITFTSKYPWLHILRVSTAAIGVGLLYMSFRDLPIIEAIAFSLLAPIVTILGACFIFKEKINTSRKIAVLFSLIGGFLIASPNAHQLSNTNNLSWVYILPLIAALIFSLNHLITKKLLSMQESPQLLTIYLLLFMGPICLLPLLYYPWIAPNSEHIIWLLLLGLLTGFAHFAFNKAYSLAEITFLMPFGIAKMLFCGLFGFLFFAEIPRSFNIWIGLFIITISTLLLAINNEKKKKGLF